MSHAKISMDRIKRLQLPEGVSYKARVRTWFSNQGHPIGPMEKGGGFLTVQFVDSITQEEADTLDAAIAAVTTGVSVVP